MPAPIEDRVTNLEALVSGIITRHGENQERADARHASIMEEFGTVHAELAEMRRESDTRHTAVIGALTEILDRLPPK